MQYNQDELRAQQLVLAFLGYYNGAIDGVWSDATIKAKQAFECHDKYPPAAPNFGLPFSHGQRLPKGLVWERGYLSHRDLTPERIQALLNKHTKPTKTPAPEAPATHPVVEVAPNRAPEKQTEEESPAKNQAKEKPHAQK